MKRLNYYRMKLMLVVVAVSVFSGLGPAKADFTFGQRVNLGPGVNSSYGDYDPFLPSGEKSTHKAIPIGGFMLDEHERITWSFRL